MTTKWSSYQGVPLQGPLHVADHKKKSFKFYYFNPGKCFNYLIKICNDFIEQPEALDALVVEVQLDVELVKVGDAGKDHSNPGVGLTVEVLRSANSCTCILSFVKIRRLLEAAAVDVSSSRVVVSSSRVVVRGSKVDVSSN